MSTSFEFLSTEEVRIRTPRISVIVFLSMTLLFGLTVFLTRIYTEQLQLDFKEASQRVDQEAMKFIEEARTMLPAQMVVEDLRVITDEHNNSIGGKRSAWTKFFNALEEVLPANSFVSSIKNASSGKSSFAAENRHFSLIISVPDMETANALYMKISNHKAFDSLSFSPSAAAELNGSISIEIAFRFREKYA